MIIILKNLKKPIALHKTSPKMFISVTDGCKPDNVRKETVLFSNKQIVRIKIKLAPMNSYILFNTEYDQVSYVVTKEESIIF